MLNFPGIYICAFYPIPRLYVQIEHKLACCSHFKYFQLEIRKKKISGCELFLITMIEPKKRKAFSIQEKMAILAQVDANKETRVALTARLGIAPSTLNTIVKSRKDTEKCYAQCGRFSGQRKSLKQSPFEELESLLVAWFKQARGTMQ
jgi:hypothetical protein